MGRIFGEFFRETEARGYGNAFASAAVVWGLAVEAIK